MFLGLMTQTATRLRGTYVEDPYSGESNEVSWDDPDTLEIPRCSVQPEQGQDDVMFDREMVTMQYRMWVPGRPDIAATDRIRHDGKDFEITGEPMFWGHTRMAHTMIQLRRIEG